MKHNKTNTRPNRVVKTLQTTLIKASTKSLDWLIPYRCLKCSAILKSTKSAFCLDCYSGLPFLENCCTRCGQSISHSRDYCGNCLESPPNFDRCYCIFSYESVIKQKISDAKYNYHPHLMERLAYNMAEEIITNETPLPDLIIPVPLHISRLRQRGFNQSLIMARVLSHQLGVEYSNNIVSKVKNTQPQAELSLAERKMNLKRSFKLTEDIRVKHVAIVDDVFTTGATTTEITKILKRNGVDYVQVWGLAHTL